MNTGFRLCLLAILTLSAHRAQCQTPAWDWAAGVSASGGVLAGKVLAASTGDIYVSGTFSGALAFGTGTITSNGRKDAYIARYSSSGTLVWARSVGGNLDDEAGGMAEDQGGNIYFTGSFTDSARVDGQTLPGYGGQDVFLLKYAPDGSLIWAKHEGGANDDYPGIGGICADRSNHIILCGAFGAVGGSSPVFGTGNFGGISLTATGSTTAYLAKLDTSGRAIWAKKGGGLSGTRSTQVAADGADNYYIVGGFSNRTFFDQVKLEQKGYLMSSDIFIVKYDSAGAAQWGKTVYGSVNGPGLGVVFGISIAVDKLGNSVIVGTYDRCNAVTENFVLPEFSANDILIVGYDSAGQNLWARRAGSDGRDEGRDVVMDDNGNAYVTGAFVDSGIFGDDTLRGQNYVVYVTKYDRAGFKQWVTLADGPDGELGTGLAIDGAGSIFLTGQSGSSSMSFGSLNLGIPGGSLFLAKLKASATGIQLQQSASTALYPNPARNLVTLTQSEGFTGNRYTLVNALGQNVASGALSLAREQPIKLPSIPDGLYYLRVFADDGRTLQHRLLIQH